MISKLKQKIHYINIWRVMIPKLAENKSFFPHSYDTKYVLYQNGCTFFSLDLYEGLNENGWLGWTGLICKYMVVMQ